jgi:DNA repair protein RadD
MIRTLILEYLKDQMTKFNLRTSITSKVFKNPEMLDEYSHILEELDPEQLSILHDDVKLEELYITQNSHKFKEKKFRISLLEGSFGQRNFNTFCQKIGIKSISLNASESQKKKFIEKLAQFQWSNDNTTRQFIEAFDLDEGFIPLGKKEKNIELIEKPEIPYYPMLVYQIEIYDQAKKKLWIPSERRIIRVPTGGGKTKIAMEIITDFFNENTDAKILWLAHSQELLEQATKEFIKNWSVRGLKSIHLNRAWGTNSVKSDINGSELIVGGLQKLISFYKNKGKIKADLIIFDEAHHSAAKEYLKVIEKSSKISTRLLGLTATPARGEEDETQKLASIFNDNPPIAIDTHDKYQTPIQFLQKIGMLSKLKFKILSIPKFPRSIFTDQDFKKIKKCEEYDKELLIKIGQIRARNRRILKHLLELNDQGKQVLYFGPSVEQSKLMTLLLSTFNVKVGVVDKDTPKEYRAELIKKFHEKKINFLLNYEVFTSGFDSPKVDTVFIARPTKSSNTLLQMMGRGMRGPKAQGTSSCDIVYVQDSVLEEFQNFEKLYKSYDEYYEQEKLTE